SHSAGCARSCRDVSRTMASFLAVAQNPAAHARMAKLHLLGGALGRVLIKSRPIGDRRLMSAQPQRRRKSGHSLTAAWCHKQTSPRQMLRENHSCKIIVVAHPETVASDPA